MDRGSVDFLLQRTRDAIGSIDSESEERLKSLILSKKKIFVYGSGRSGLVGQLFSVRLVQMVLDVHFVGDMTTPIIGRDDLTIIISNRGETVSGTQTAQIARRLGSHVVTITSRGGSKLAKASDTVITLKIADDEERHELAPLGTVFEDAVMLFFDAMVPSMMERLGVTEIDMRNRHAIWV